MKKIYFKPEVQVMAVESLSFVLAGSVDQVTNNAGLDETITGGSGPARARSFGGWSDGEEE